jgi:hypothetical protein
MGAGGCYLAMKNCSRLAEAGSKSTPPSPLPTAISPPLYSPLRMIKRFPTRQGLRRLLCRVTSCQHASFYQTDVGNSLVVVSPHGALPPETEALQSGDELSLVKTQVLAWLASKILLSHCACLTLTAVPGITLRRRQLVFFRISTLSEDVNGLCTYHVGIFLIFFSRRRTARRATVRQTS